ncbi:hypothetical protein E2C01_085972 [Portunus trituberculatus]|uniref:Uncharacterized protein n=1 Tax=Portunus trituberculatus TaxID=210409 RepID=A0A5B7JF32_PORTR|nr:hypothetical protein [Portunus trituberculatus]
MGRGNPEVWGRVLPSQASSNLLHLKSPPLCVEDCNTELRDPRLRPREELPIETDDLHLNIGDISTMDINRSKRLYEDSDEESAPPTSRFRSEKEENDNPWVDVGKRKPKNNAESDQPRLRPPAPRGFSSHQLQALPRQ